MFITFTRRRVAAAAAAIAALVSLAIPVSAHADTALAGTQIVRLQGGGLRFLDAHEISEKDFQVVTRPFQGFDTTQQWRMTDVGNGLKTIQQVSSGRFLDAHEIP